MTSNNRPTTTRQFFIAFVEGANKVAKTREVLKKRTTGTYTMMVQAGISAKDGKKFDAAAERFCNEIRKNRGNIAIDLNCVQAKKTPKGEKVAPYTVPQSFMSARSYVKAAYDRGVELVDDSGDPRSFTAIRQDVMDAKAEEDFNNLKGFAKVRAEMLSDLDAVTKRVKELEDEQLDDVYQAVEWLLNEVSQLAGGEDIDDIDDADDSDARNAELAEAAIGLDDAA